MAANLKAIAFKIGSDELTSPIKSWSSSAGRWWSIRGWFPQASSLVRLLKEPTSC